MKLGNNIHRTDFEYVTGTAQQEFVRIDGLPRVSSEPLRVQIITGGIVLPELSETQPCGVASQDGVFIPATSFSFRSERNQMEILDQKITESANTAIFIGCLCPVWGHCFIEDLSRLWFLKSEIGQDAIRHGAKIVYTNHLGEALTTSFTRLLCLADVDTKDWIGVEEPTRFAQVIVPDATFCRIGDATFNALHLNLIEKILSHVKGECEPCKLYFSRTSLPSIHLREYGERQIEAVFRRLGFLIVAPELLPLEEQLLLLKSCKSFVATEGSIAHNSIFCQPGTKVTILRKANYKNLYQLCINHMRNLDVTYVDANHSVPPYPKSIMYGPFYLYITQYLERYVGHKILHRPYWIRPSYWWYVLRRRPLIARIVANRNIVHQMERFCVSSNWGYIPDSFFRHLPQFIRISLLERGRYLFSRSSDICSDKALEALKSFPVLNAKSGANRLNRLVRFNPDLKLMVIAFCSHKINVLKLSRIADDSPILVCVQKDDLLRVQASIEYHRKLGIKNFAIIDNGSTDGSFEWLKEQPDVFLLQTLHPYSSANRDAWINRVLAHFGDNRWYLVLDSDEFLAYDDMEHRDIGQLLSQLKREGITRARAMMLDMYAADGYFETGSREDFLRQCVYFDADTYTTFPWDYHVALNGGPRKRLFNTEATLTKYPLFFLQRGELIYQAHAMFPLAKNLNTPCHLVLRHYTFLPGDKVKFAQIAREGRYYGGSVEYKNYVARMAGADVLKFVFEGSQRYVDSTSLRAITCYDPIVWKS